MLTLLCRQREPPPSQLVLMHDPIGYKVFTADQWTALQSGTFQGAPIDIADGYVHLSTAAQLTETVDRHFMGQAGLVIAAIDLKALGQAVRWEPSRHAQSFPHLYAPLKLNDVVAWCPLRRDVGGAVCLP